MPLANVVPVFEVAGLAKMYGTPILTAMCLPKAYPTVEFRAIRDSGGQIAGFSKVVRDATDRKQAEEGLRILSARLLQMRDEERRRIARDLHDSAGQLIAAINMKLVHIADNGKTEPEINRVVRESLELLNQLSSEVPTISHLLHPPLLDEVGLASALRLYLRPGLSPNQEFIQNELFGNARGGLSAGFRGPPTSQREAIRSGRPEPLPLSE